MRRPRFFLLVLAACAACGRPGGVLNKVENGEVLYAIAIDSPDGCLVRADAVDHLTGLAHVFEFEPVCPPATHLLWLPAGSYSIVVTTDGQVTMAADVVVPNR